MTISPEKFQGDIKNIDMRMHLCNRISKITRSMVPHMKRLLQIQPGSLTWQEDEKKRVISKLSKG